MVSQGFLMVLCIFTLIHGVNSDSVLRFSESGKNRETVPAVATPSTQGDKDVSARRTSHNDVYAESLHYLQALYKASKTFGDEYAKEIRGKLLKLHQLLANAYVGESVESDPGKSQATTLLPVPRKANESQCAYDMAEWRAGLKNDQSWAIKMVDAAGKPPAGIMEGFLKWFGAYDECIAIKATTKNTTIVGQYCSMEFILPKISADFPFIYGFCVPNSCSPAELEEPLEQIISEMRKLNFTFNGITCQRGAGALDGKAILAIIIYSLLLFLVICGTLIDLAISSSWFTTTNTKTAGENLVEQKTDINNPDPETTAEQTALIKQRSQNVKAEHGKLLRCLLAFSVYTNGKKLFNATHSEGSFTFIHGIRFISMAWIILGHTVVLCIKYFTNGVHYGPIIFSRWTAELLVSSPITVDTFFMISGFLLVYFILKELNKRRLSINFFVMYYFHRYWRLTPAYMLILMFWAVLFKYIGQGPQWIDDGPKDTVCSEGWWKNLLYINSYDGIHNMCMGWSWYLSNDMIFYVISPLIFLPMLYFKTKGLIVLFALLLASCTASGIISTKYKMGATILGFTSSTDDYYNYYYFVPHTRIGAYLVGMLVGYILYATDGKFYMKKWTATLIWLCFGVVSLAVIYGLYDPNGTNMTNNLSVSVAALYNSLHRIAWASCVGWVVLACAWGYAGPVNTFLSWTAFIPLSRLTYCAYLVHPIIITYYFEARNTPYYMSDNNLIMAFLGFLVGVYAIAMVASLVFESPMMALEKALLGGRRKDKKNTETAS